MPMDLDWKSRGLCSEQVQAREQEQEQEQEQERVQVQVQEQEQERVQERVYFPFLFRSSEMSLKTYLLRRSLERCSQERLT